GNGPSDRTTRNESPSQHLLSSARRAKSSLLSGGNAKNYYSLGSRTLNRLSFRRRHICFSCKTPAAWLRAWPLFLPATHSPRFFYDHVLRRRSGRPHQGCRRAGLVAVRETGLM